MSRDPLEDCFREFRASAWRLETLPAYLEPSEVAQIQAWREGRPRPERSVRNDDYLRGIAADVLAGRQRRRIRVTARPVPEYVRWELAGLAENAAAGEETRIAAARVGDGDTFADFWMFDHGTSDERVVLLDYDRDGRFTAARLADVPEIASCRAQWLTAEACSVPLNEYLAAVRKAASAA